MQRIIENFRLDDRPMRYSLFVPRLYNYCLSLGFQRETMMPSRAFCSDESQGYPIMLMAQHFGTFPFDHGLVGGKVALDRHGPHAHHGEDLVIVQTWDAGKFEEIDLTTWIEKSPKYLVSNNFAGVPAATLDKLRQS